MGADDTGGILNALARRAGRVEPDVVLNSTGKQKRVLQYHRDVARQ